MANQAAIEILKDAHQSLKARWNGAMRQRDFLAEEKIVNDADISDLETRMAQIELAILDLEKIPAE